MDCTEHQREESALCRSWHLPRSQLVAGSLFVTLLTVADVGHAHPQSHPDPDRQSTDETQALPEEELFRWLIADPRESVFSLRYLKDYSIGEGSLDEESDVAEVSLGEYFGLFQGESSLGSWQLGLEAAVFSLFNLDSSSLNLVNADYRIGLPLTGRKDDWSYRIRLFHQSSHLGDEFILQNPDVERENLSYEAAEAVLAYQWGGFRPYAGVGYVLSSDQDLEPGRLQYGADFRRQSVIGPFSLLAGINVSREEEQDWEPSRSYRIGLDYPMNHRSVALLFEYFDGFSPTGQFLDVPIEYYGAGLYFRF